MKAAITRRRATPVAAAVFLLTAAFVLAKTGRDALYFQMRGVLDLPYAYLAIAALALPFALLAYGAMRGLGPRRARVVVPLALSLLLALYALVARPGGGALMTLFFTLIPLSFGVVFSLAWLLTASLYRDEDPEDLAPVYGAVGAASIAGGVAGGLVASMLAVRVPPAVYAWIASATVALATVVIARTHAPRTVVRSAAPARSAPRASARDLMALARDRTARLLLLAGMAGAVAGLLVEFQFYLAASGMIGGGGGSTGGMRFFAMAYLALNLAALAVQLVVFPALERRVGVAGTLLVLPLALLGGAGVLAASATTFMRALLRVTEGGLKASIHRASWEQAFLALPHPERSSAKLLIDGVGARLAEGATAGALVGFVAVRGGDLTSMSVDLGWFTWGLLAAAGTWAYLTLRIGARLPFHKGPANHRMPEACCMTAALGEAAEEEEQEEDR